MPRFPIFRLGKEPEKLALPRMVAAAPSIVLEGLAVGVDNLRHDVALSGKFVEAARAQIMRLIVRHGELEGLLAAEAPKQNLAPSWMRDAAAAGSRGTAPIASEASGWKPLLAELQRLRDRGISGARRVARQWLGGAAHPALQSVA